MANDVKLLLVDDNPMVLGMLQQCAGAVCAGGGCRGRGGCFA